MSNNFPFFPFLMKKFGVYSLIFLVLIVFTFTGCRKKGPPEETGDYSGVELTYYKVFDDADVIEPVIRDFVPRYPGLKIRYKKFDDFDEYQRTVLNEMAEGRGPDIFSMQNTWFAGNFRKLAPMPAEFSPDGDDATLIDDYADTFVEVAYKDLVRTDEEGQLQVFAVPMTVDTVALYYNKDHFEDRIPTSGEPSFTWEGIKEDVIKLKKEDNSVGNLDVAGIAIGRGDNISRGVDTLYLLFLQFGVDFYNDIMSEAVFAGQKGGVAVYPGAEALDFLQTFADPDQRHYTWNEFIADKDGEKELEAFAKGKVSMMMGFAYTYNDILKQIEILKSKGVRTIGEDDIRIAPIPQVFDPETSVDKRVTYASYFAETVSRNSKYPDIAWDFLLELTLKENLENYFEKTHKPTSRRDMIDAQKQDPLYGVFASQIGYAESFPIVDYYAYKRIFEAVIDGEKSLLNAQREISELLPLEGLVIPEKEKSEDNLKGEKVKDDMED